MLLYVFLSFFTFFILGLPYSILLFSKQSSSRKSILEIFILTAVIGPLIINYLIFTLGYAGLLSRENMFLLILIVIFTPFLLRSVRSSLKEFYFLIRRQICQTRVVFGKLTLIEAFSISLIVSILIITSYSAFTKAPVLRDPYAVWLFYGKKIMETGTIPLYYGNAPDISWSGNYPPLISFLSCYYFICLNKAIPEAFTHITWLYGGLTLLATFMLARELGSRKIALMSACLLTTSSLFTLELINYGYVTIVWSFYVVVASFYFVKCMHEITMHASLSFGLSLGAALLSTYLSLIFAASLLVLLSASILIKKIRKNNGLFEFKLVIGLIAALIIALPWFIRNYVLLKNPVYPWFYEMLDGKWINLDLIRRVPQSQYTVLELLTDNTFFAMANEDIGFTLLIFGLIGSLYLIWRRKKTLVSLGGLTFTFFITLLASMVLFYGYERYLLMVAPLLAVSAGYFLNKIFSLNKTNLKILILVSIVIFSLPNYVYLISLTPYGAPVGETDSLSYIESYIDSYLPSNATILTNEIQLYFINRKAINVYNLPEVFQAKNMTELINSLKLHNITHILINDVIDPTVLGKTFFMHALTEENRIFEVLLSIYSYKLYDVDYGEILP